MTHTPPDPDGLKAARILVVGDAMLDRFVYGDVDRISPEAPIPVMRAARDIVMAGGAGNVARNIAALGARCVLVALVGDDAAAQELNDALQVPGIEALLVVDPERPTAEKIRFIGGRQQLLRVDRERVAAPGRDAQGTLIDAALEALDQADAVILSDYAKGVVNDALLAALIPAAAKAGKPVLVDPKGTDFTRYRGATLLKPNRKEATLASGLPCGSDDEALAAANKLIESCGVAHVLITRGGGGMTLAGADGSALHLATEAREVFDVSGAGDTVIATLALAMAVKHDLPMAAKLANAAAGIVVGKVGTATVQPEELRAALHMPDPHGIEAKIADLPRAKALVATWRGRGERIGFTNGGFDLLHAGHLTLLSEARSLCDRLIVAINSDAGIRKSKGPNRPVQDQVHRARLLASLAFVDMVIVFDDETPIPLLEALRPDLLIKGGDYGLDGVVGADLVRSYGGEVRVSAEIPGLHTSNIIAKLKAGDDIAKQKS
ncbi:D-glycero-beta-D-manno-heptose-7-phosphate kinase [Ferrovibrio sp.]|uniref:D-glycero-beta-D-manno-heptose-7-phosphate kinase n=1 Tax=Ferrovibrio sp. TaxID=1917215 RepID=UPI0025BDABB2|nr:D-glycero-beta-D-manno-heptose-7-phosphate kinase [Ferrovibrio sp.]MBX3455048.1 D-glycero-beta-D-manno-heptose-7-phosphate kinase [Ferrovibrio sp.]